KTSEKEVPINNGNDCTDLFDERIDLASAILVRPPERHDVEIVERAQSSDAGFCGGRFFVACGLDSQKIYVTKSSKRAGSIAEQLRMLFEQVPGCRAIECGSTKEVVRRKAGVLVGSRGGWLETDFVPLLCQPSTEFCIFGDAKCRV